MYHNCATPSSVAPDLDHVINTTWLGRASCVQPQRSTIKDADAVGAGGGSIGTGMQRLVALVGEVEGGRVSLAPLRMEHPLLGTTALQQQVYSHYMRAALPELVKLVGSANVLGAPLFPTVTHPDPLRPHVPPRAS